MAEHPRLKLLPDGPFIEVDGGALFLGRGPIRLSLSLNLVRERIGRFDFA